MFRANMLEKVRKEPGGLNSRGFTLIEMMISVVIIGVIATMAGPRLNKEITRIEFRGATQEMVSTLREARSRSITEKQQYSVGFNSAAGSYTLSKVGVTQNVLVRTEKIPGGAPSLSQSFSGPLVFSQDGSANNSGQIVLYSFNDDGTGASTSFATIDVLASTGRIKVMDISTY